MGTKNNSEKFLRTPLYLEIINQDLWPFYKRKKKYPSNTIWYNSAGNKIYRKSFRGRKKAGTQIFNFPFYQEKVLHRFTEIYISFILKEYIHTCAGGELPGYLSIPYFINNVSNQFHICNFFERLEYQWKLNQNSFFIYFFLSLFLKKLKF